MKQNSRALLFSLYHTELRQEDTGFRPYQYFYDLFSELSEGGIRSLLRQLVSLQLVVKKSIGNQSLFKIAETGRLWVEEYYPCLKSVSTQNRAGFLVILKPAEFKNTRQLYRLKKVLERYPHQIVSSQVWWFPRLSQEVKTQLVQMYSQQVLCVEIKQWLMGSIEQHNNEFSTDRTTDRYVSSVSEQTKKLLDILNDKKRLTDKSKQNWQSIFRNLFLFCEKYKSSSIFTKDKKRLIDRALNDNFYLGFFQSA